MAGDLTSSELKDPFAQAMKRAVEPPDVWTPRRILALQIFACGGMVYSMWCGGWLQPLGVAIFFSSALLLGLCQQTKGLLLRIERLEADPYSATWIHAANFRPLDVIRLGATTEGGRMKDEPDSHSARRTPHFAPSLSQILKMRPRDVRLGFAGRPADDEGRGGVRSIHDDHPQEQGAAR
jgi:hypothetical protein